ncbi:MAG: hypothetical protein ACRDRX_23700 [Pseudonocardiaceae bacterium]
MAAAVEDGRRFGLGRRGPPVAGLHAAIEPVVAHAPHFACVGKRLQDRVPG